MARHILRSIISCVRSKFSLICSLRSSLTVLESSEEEWFLGEILEDLKAVDGLPHDDLGSARNLADNGDVESEKS